MIVDANILIRAVLGSKVLLLLTGSAQSVSFFAPQIVFDEAREHLPFILKKRGIEATDALLLLDSLRGLISQVEPEIYAGFEATARLRLQRRDEKDWPILAAALAIGSPNWTEDTDFFGCGVAIWTTDRVDLYFKEVTCATE